MIGVRGQAFQDDAAVTVCSALIFVLNVSGSSSASGESLRSFSSSSDGAFSRSSSNSGTGGDAVAAWGVWSAVKDVMNRVKPIISGTSPVAVVPGEWYTYRIDVNGSALNVWINGMPVVVNMNTDATSLASGHALIGE